MKNWLIIILFLVLPIAVHAQALPPMDCYNVFLKNASDNYYIQRAFNEYYDGFLELDGGTTPIRLFGLEQLWSSFEIGPGIQGVFANTAKPDGLFTNQGVPLCPAVRGSLCGYKQCTDIYIESQTPQYRLFITDFKSGNYATLTLIGNNIQSTNFSQKFELNDIINDEINQIFFSPNGKKLFRLGVTGNEYQDKALELEFIAMSFYDKAFLQSLLQSSIAGQIKQGITSPELQNKLDRIAALEDTIQNANIPDEKQKELIQKVTDLKSKVVETTVEKQTQEIEKMINELNSLNPSEKSGKVKLQLTNFVQAIKTKFASVDQQPYKNLVNNPIEGLRSGLKVYNADAAGNRTGSPLDVTVSIEGTDTLVVSSLKEGKNYEFVVKFVSPFPTDHPEITGAFRVKKVE